MFFFCFLNPLVTLVEKALGQLEELQQKDKTVVITQRCTRDPGL